MLEGVEHQGIQRVLDYREAGTRTGAHIRIRSEFDRLDRYLAEKQQPYRSRNGWRWCVNSARRWPSPMASACTIVALPLRTSWFEPETDNPRLQITNWQVASRGEGSSTGWR